MQRFMLLAAVLLLQFGCSATPDPLELNHPVYQRLINAELVTIEIIQVNGCEAFDKSLEKAIEGFSKYVAGKVHTVEGKSVELEADKDGLLTQKQLNPIIEKRRYRSPSDFTILLVPGLSDYEHRGSCHYLPNDGDHVIVIQTNNVDFGSPFLTSREKWWTLVIKHELLHALNVPSDRSHAWSGRHCTTANCILYPRVDFRAIISGIFLLGPPMDLCGVCRKEIHQVQLASSGKLIGPSEPYDYMDELDKLVALNPKHPNVYTTRAWLHASRKDFDSGIADLTRALEVSKERGLTVACYLNRAGMFKMSGDPEAAKRDLDQMTDLTSSDVKIRNNVAWILATHPNKWFRDGSYAVQLAQRACEMSQWKESAFLDTLAAAHAENGNFDKAIEFENKAISLSKEKTAEKFRQRLKLYYNKKPFRNFGSR